VIECLTNDDMIEFLVKCKKSLKPNGIIVIKENTFQKGFCI